MTATDQARLGGLNFTATALVKAGIDPARLLNQMSEEIAVFERETKQKVLVKCGREDGIWFTINCGRKAGADYFKVAKPNEVRFLSARIDGVVMSANFLKPAVYNHDNAHVAKALRRLADIVEKAPVRLAERDIELKVDP